MFLNRFLICAFIATSMALPPHLNDRSDNPKPALSTAKQYTTTVTPDGRGGYNAVLEPMDSLSKKRDTADQDGRGGYNGAPQPPVKDIKARDEDGRGGYNGVPQPPASGKMVRDEDGRGGYNTAPGAATVELDGRGDPAPAALAERKATPENNGRGGYNGVPGSTR
ncbi:MAG: hypothetical protein Q9227_001123 [Pyrenula ochraceoflavens]